MLSAWQGLIESGLGEKPEMYVPAADVLEKETALSKAVAMTRKAPILDPPPTSGETGNIPHSFFPRGPPAAYGSRNQYHTTSAICSAGEGPSLGEEAAILPALVVRPKASIPRATPACKSPNPNMGDNGPDQNPSPTHTSASIPSTGAQ